MTEIDDLPELTREDAIAEMERLATELYRAEDLIAFIREQLDQTAEPIEPIQLRQWLNYTGCAHGEPHVGPSADSLVRMLRHARVSTLQQAFRELGWSMDFELAEGEQP